MSLLDAAIGWLAPAQCINCGDEGPVLCDECSDFLIQPFGERCWRCNSLSPGGKTCVKCRQTGAPGFVWISTDHDSIARELLSLYKFGHQRVAGDSIAHMMIASFLSFNDEQTLDHRNYLIVSIPTATSRIRERGFGHSELLAKNIAEKLYLDQSNVLRRLDQTRQLGAKREDRLKQLQSSFAAKNSKQIAGRNILLIDDVVTTGGTLIAATQVLRSAGAKRVDALLFAKRL